MSASIADPFVLSTYALPKTASSAGHVFATHCAIPGRSEPLVVVTAQADGVHILDSSALHPVVSRTFGPSTTFVCSSVVRSVDGICTTYAAIESAPDVPATEKGRTLWSWTNDISAGVFGDEVIKATLPHPIAALHVPAELGDTLLAVSPTGDLTLLDDDLKVIGESAQPSSSAGGHRLVKCAVFARKGSAFVDSRTAASAYTVLVLSKASRLAVRIFAVDGGDCTLLGETHVPGVETSVAEVSISPSGVLTVIDEAGSWYSFQLEASSTGVTLSALAEPLRLQHISFAAGELSLLGVSSSFVLLAGIRSTGEPEVVLHLWDTQYSALLASQTAPLPSSLPRAGGLSVRIADATPSGAVLVLAPRAPTKGKKAVGTDARASVLVVPLAVPASSTIAGALGRAAASAEWVAKGVTKAKAQDGGQDAVVMAMRKALDQNRPQAADDAFFVWQEAHPDAMLDREFTKRLLELVLQPAKQADVLYSPKVVRHLLEKKAVASAMLEPGLLPSLQKRHDWTSIRLALTSVIDIPESDLVTLLHVAVNAHRERSPDAMQVDAVPAGTPALPAVLADVVRAATSPAALRLAFAQHLRAAEDVVCVLGVLDGWLVHWDDAPPPLAPAPGELHANEKGVYVRTTPASANASDVPSLEQIVAFLQPLLDASFLALLQHAPAHRALRRLTRRLAPELAQADALAALQAPLAPFARAQARAERDGVPPGRAAPPPKTGDWRKRRRAAHEQASLALGVYQVEELVL